MNRPGISEQEGCATALERLQQRVAELESELLEQDQNRAAMLIMLEDLEASRQQVEHAQAEWRAAFDAVDDPIFLHDRAYRVMRCNLAYARAAGRNIKEVIGLHYWEVFPRRDGPLASCLNTLETHKTTGEEIQLEDGSTWVSRSFPMQNPGGEHEYSVHLMRDITQAQQIQSKQIILSQALRQSAAAMVIINPQQRIEFVNPAFEDLLGYAGGEIEGREAAMLWQQMDVNGEYLQPHIAANSHWRGEIACLASDASLVPVYFSGAPLKGLHDDPVGYVVSLVDLRPLKLANSRVNTLLEVIESLSTETDLQLIGEMASEAARIISGADWCGIALLDPAGDQLTYHWQTGGYGKNRAARLQRPISPGEGLAGEVFRTGKPRLVEDYLHYSHALPELTEAGVSFAAGVPIVSGERVVGSLSVASMQPLSGRHEGFMSVLEAVSRQLGVAVQRQRLLDEVRDSEGRLQEVMDAVPDILYQIRLPGWDVVYVSPAITEVLGYAREEFIHHNDKWMAIVHEDDRDGLREKLQRAVSQGEKDCIDEYRVWHKDGKRLKWVRDHSVIHAHGRGGEMTIFGAVSDITEREEARLAQRESEARFTDLFERMLNSFALLEIITDSQGHPRDFRFLDINPAFSITTGLQAEVAIGHTARELLPGLEDFWVDTFGKVALTGQPEQFNHYAKPLDGYFEGVAFSAEQGKVAVVFNDVTERHQAEIALKRAMRALRTRNAVSEGIIRARDRQRLLADICHVVVESGGYHMAFVAVAEASPGRPLRTVAHSGHYWNYLEEAPMALEDDSVCQCVPVQAMQQGKPAMVADIANDPRCCRWREAGLARKYGSAIALPLIVDGECDAVLCIFATEVQAFDDEELMLLEQMAGDVSYGLHSLRASEKQQKAQADLRVSEARMRSLIESEMDGIVVVDASGQILFVNRPAEQLLGGAGASLLGSVLAEELLAGDMPEHRLALEGDNYATVEVKQLETDWEGQPARIISLHDISGLRHLEEERLSHTLALEQTLVQIIQTMARAVEKRDPYTAGHQQRVSDLAVAIATEMGLDEDRIKGIRLGGIIHDIGKIYIPSEILNRPGKLSPVEFEMIKTHSLVGEEIVQDVEFPWPVSEMIVQHHERLDGTGYPRGLKGEEICLEARILTVADVVEAITSHRPYRPGLGLEVALEEISSKRGLWYDAAAVDACLTLFREQRFQW